MGEVRENDVGLDEIDDDDAPSSRGGRKKDRFAASPSMLRLAFGLTIAGSIVGLSITMVFLMALVGAVASSTWIRAIVSLLFAFALPAFAAERLLKRFTPETAALSFLARVAAAVWMLAAVALVGIAPWISPLLVREGDRHAEAGRRTWARVVYFCAGVTPFFPEDREPSTGDPAKGEPSNSTPSNGEPPK